MARIGTYKLQVGEKEVPLDIYKERRASVRISIGKKSLILRVPSMVPHDMLQQHIDWAQKWIAKQLHKNPTILDRFILKVYEDGDLIHITDKTYQLRIREEHRKTNSGEVLDDTLLLKLTKGLTPDQKQTVISKLIRRLVAIDRTPDVSERILQLNDQYFQKPIKDVKLKYNTSNWGSCSSSSNINISTRLLLAPREVQDYVFIHELAHLEEMNHSPRFWKIVSDVMPDYMEKEEWLKKNGHLCRL